jgi:hypothetical protein
MHFESEKFDAFKYNFKTGRAMRECDRFQFEKLARKFRTVDSISRFCVLNVVSGNKYIREMSEECCKERMAHIESFSYQTKQEIKRMLQLRPLDEWIRFDSEKNNRQIFSDESVSLETKIALDHVFNFRRDMMINNDPFGINKSFFLRLDKYRQFLLHWGIPIAKTKDFIIPILRLECQGV